MSVSEFKNSLIMFKFPLTSLWKQITPAQIREAEKSLKIMEAMIEAMTPGYFLSNLFYREK